MVKNTKEKNDTATHDLPDSLNEYVLVLYNDDINDFDFVIECLVEVCKHDLIQAEQCALITHYNGKCEIKDGAYLKLKPLKETLIDKGLNVNIE